MFPDYLSLSYDYDFSDRSKLSLTSLQLFFNVVVLARQLSWAKQFKIIQNDVFPRRTWAWLSLKVKNNLQWNKLQWHVSAALHFSFFLKLKLNYIKTVHFSFYIKTAIKLPWSWNIKKLKSIYSNTNFFYFELIVKLH